MLFFESKKKMQKPVPHIYMHVNCNFFDNHKKQKVAIDMPSKMYNASKTDY